MSTTDPRIVPLSAGDFLALDERNGLIRCAYWRPVRDADDRGPSAPYAPAMPFDRMVALGAIPSTSSRLQWVRRAGEYESLDDACYALLQGSAHEWQTVANYLRLVGAPGA